MTGVSKGSLLLALALALAWLALGSTGAMAQDKELSFVVIAAAGATEQRHSREAIARIFMRKQTLWENGLRIQPVNLPATHPLRRAFSQSILGGAPRAFEDYWRDMYFNGVLPPHVLASEEAVLLFVATTPGAIGYVSACPVGQRIGIVLVVGNVPDCPK